MSCAGRAGSPQTWKSNKPQEFCCMIWGFRLKPWPKSSWGRLFALEFQQLCYLSRSFCGVPSLLWVCEQPVPPPWSLASAEQWQKQGKETKAEPPSAKSILFSWLKSRKYSFSRFFKECWNFGPWFHHQISGKKTAAGCGMLLPWVYWVLREKASVRKSDLCKMLEFGKLTSPSLKTSRESCCVKSLNCCSQFVKTTPS